jgi:cellular nucleic acid-binding protein
MARECTASSEITCYVCGKTGHISRDCNKDACYSCGESGHLARDCTEKGGSGGARGDRNADTRCYNCNKKGHIAQNCPSEA